MFALMKRYNEENCNPFLSIVKEPLIQLHQPRSQHLLWFYTLHTGCHLWTFKTG